MGAFFQNCLSGCSLQSVSQVTVDHLKFIIAQKTINFMPNREGLGHNNDCGS